MVRILATGDDIHRLEDLDGRAVGWIANRSIGFQGFVSRSQAIAAAIEAWRALETALGREYAGRPPAEIDAARVRVQSGSRTTWITDGATRIARLDRFEDGNDGEASFSIELDLPSYASEGAAVAAANLMARTLEEHLQLRAAPSGYAGSVI